MKKPHHPAIRELLRGRPDGMTPGQIVNELPEISSWKVARGCLEAMPDAYIDRWIRTPGCRGQFVAVWCVVTPPKNCPYPTNRFTPKTVWQELRA